MGNTREQFNLNSFLVLILTVCVGVIGFFANRTLSQIDASLAGIRNDAAAAMVRLEKVERKVADLERKMGQGKP